MWALKLLTGPLAGQLFNLKEGTNQVGRAPHCEVKLPSSGVSKEHAKIDVLGGKLIITDLNSRNGTFLNGIQVKSQRMAEGDKIAFHDILVELVQGQAQPRVAQARTPLQPKPEYPSFEQPSNEFEAPVPVKLEMFQWLRNYVETVALPGVYRLPEIVEFKFVLLGFMALFLIFTTSLSSIPLMTILKSSIEKESQRRALTIARTLAQINRPALMQGLESSVTIDIAAREPGVEKAMIISHVDGNVIAPASLAGTYPNIPFVHEARRLNKEAVEQLSNSRIGALVPIEFFNAETGANQTAAYAVVIYDMGTLAVDDGRTLSLFIQTFVIALIVGGLLFFFMYKLIEFPLSSVNNQLSTALREGQTQVQSKYLFPALQTLITNINSSLHRMGQSNPQESHVNERDRHSEMSNLVELMGFGAIAVSANSQVITAVNPAFEQSTGLSVSQLQHGSLTQIPDQSLKKSLVDLVERLQNAPDQMATNDLEFSGRNYQVAGQAVFGAEKVAYFLFVLVPVEGA